MRQRVSLSLTKKLAESIDAHVGVLGASRSAVIERMLQNFLDTERTCIILAGGGDYLVSDGEYRPFMKIGDKTLIEDIVAKVSGQGYKNIIIIGSNTIGTRCFGIFGNGDASHKISYIEEKEPKGAASTLALARDRVSSSFLFVPCDHYFDFDLRVIEKAHRNGGFTVTLAIYGGVKYDNNTSAVAELEGMKIINYWDTPKTEKTRLVSTMIGFSEPDIFKLIPPCPSSLHMDIFPALAKKRVLGGVIVSGNFVNVHGREDANTAKKISKTGWQPR